MATWARRAVPVSSLQSDYGIGLVGCGFYGPDAGKRKRPRGSRFSAVEIIKEIFDNSPGCSLKVFRFYCWHCPSLGVNKLNIIYEKNRCLR